MNFLERLERKASGLLMRREEDAMENCGDVFLALDRGTRALRQTVVLEEEIFGHRPVPGVRAPANVGSTNANSAEAKPDAKQAEAKRPEAERSLSDRERPDHDNFNRLTMGQMVGEICDAVHIEPETVGGLVDYAKTVDERAKPARAALASSPSPMKWEREGPAKREGEGLTV